MTFLKNYLAAQVAPEDMADEINHELQNIRQLNRTIQELTAVTEMPVSNALKLSISKEILSRGNVEEVSMESIDDLGMEGIGDILKGLSESFAKRLQKFVQRFDKAMDNLVYNFRGIIKRVEILEKQLDAASELKVGRVTLSKQRSKALLMGKDGGDLPKDLSPLTAAVQALFSGKVHENVIAAVKAVPYKDKKSLEAMHEAAGKALQKSLSLKASKIIESAEDGEVAMVDGPYIGNFHGAFIYGKDGQLEFYDYQIYPSLGYDAKSLSFQTTDKAGLSKILADIKNTSAWYEQNYKKFKRLTEYDAELYKVIGDAMKKGGLDDTSAALQSGAVSQTMYALVLLDEHVISLSDHHGEVSLAALDYVKGHLSA